MIPMGKNHDEEAGTMKRKLWSVLGVVLMMVFVLMACSSSSDNKSSAKLMKTYSLAGATGVINEGAKTIAVTLPFGSVVTNLVATFTTSAAANVKIGTTPQVSGTTVNNFSSPKTYTVTAEDGSHVDYIVTVTVAPSNAKAITAYSLAGFVGTVNETAKTIAVTLPRGKDVTALVATFATSGTGVTIGATPQVSGTTANDFTSGTKTYTVTAADATTQNYVVTISYGGGTWTKMADFGGLARKEAVGFGFSATSKGYVGTGMNGSTYYSDFWEYNASTNAWTQKADFGVHEEEDTPLVRAFAIGTKGYVGTGYDGTTYYNDLWEYDPATNVWTKKDDLLGAERKDAVGFTIGSKGYVGTGFDGTLYYADFYEFNPAAAAGAQWTAKTNFGSTTTAGAGLRRASAVGLSIGAIGYIGTGFDGTSYFKDFWAYDPTANVWAKKADFGGVERMSAVALYTACGDGYVGLGMVPCGVCPPCSTTCDVCPCGKDGLYFSDFWVYDVAGDKWIQMAYYDDGEITGKRAAAVGFSLGSASNFVGTGDDGSTSGTRYYKDFWKYVP